MRHLIKEYNQLDEQQEIYTRAERNLEIFLKELDAQNYEQFDIDEDEIDYSANIFCKTWIDVLLADYNKRKRKARIKLSNLLKEIKKERKDGFKDLKPQQIYELNEKKRIDAERIVFDAELGNKDTKELIIPVLRQIYGKKAFYIF